MHRKGRIKSRSNEKIVFDLVVYETRIPKDLTIMTKEYWKILLSFDNHYHRITFLALALIIGRTCSYRETFIASVLGAFLGFPIIIVVLLITLVDLAKDRIERKK